MLFENQVEIVEAVSEDFDDLPFTQFGVPGMSEPGPNFVEHAVRLGDQKPHYDRVTKSRVYGDTIHRLYRRALYDNSFGMPVRVKKRPENVRFIPGHRWGKAYPVEGPNVQSEVMVVGRWPGIDEHNARRNMVGAFAHLFARMLRDAGFHNWEMEAWYVVNLIRFMRPPSAPDTVPASWINDCGPLLERDLQLVLPKYVLALGAEASKWFVGDEARTLSAAAGRVFERSVPLADGTHHRYHVVVSPHPAMLMRSASSDRAPEIAAALRRFHAVSHGGLAEITARQTHERLIVQTAADLEALVDRIQADSPKGSRSSPIAIDCEWEGRTFIDCDQPFDGRAAGDRIVDMESHWWERQSWLRTIQISHKPGFSAVVILRDGGERAADSSDDVGRPTFVPSLGSAVEPLIRLFTATKDWRPRLVGHNLKADLPWLRAFDTRLGDLLIKMFDAPGDLEDGPTRWRDGEGGFDTMYALHAVQETAERKLEVATANICGKPRTDIKIDQWKTEYKKRHGIANADIRGYGEVPNEYIYEYGGDDAESTIQLFHALTCEGGLMDRDQYGNPSWVPGWISQGKLLAELEMQTRGVYVDQDRAFRLSALYREVAAGLLAKLRELVGWPESEPGADDGFNPNSVYHVRSMLFNPLLAGATDSDGNPVDPRPERVRDSLVLNLMPVKSSGKPSKQWFQVLRRNEQHKYFPSADKETLGVLLTQLTGTGNTRALDVVKTLRDYRFVNRMVTTFLCVDAREETEAEAGDDQGSVAGVDIVTASKGLLGAIERDSRVRTVFLPIETGRVASRSPNLQNLSKRREKELKDILADRYLFGLRAIISATPGYLLVEADFKGAELFMMACQSGSRKMIEDCLASDHPENDPRHVDIHSRMAVRAFQLNCEPTKSALKKAGFANLRDVAKTIVFGLPYGRGNDAVVRAVEETGVKVSVEDVEKIRELIFGEYPELRGYLETCHATVKSPGFLINCFGRSRRFQNTRFLSDVQDLERQAANYPIQSGVGDSLSLAIRYIHQRWDRRDQLGDRFHMLLQIHDAVLSEVRIDCLPWYINEVLPSCMTEAVTVYPVNALGQRLPDAKGYHIPIETTVAENWNESITIPRLRELVQLGLDPKIASTIDPKFSMAV